MVGKPENILVEFDYNNITIIDPNKVIDSDNNVFDRLIKQEDLVMYANLECDVIPRTKLAIGTGIGDSIRTVSIAKVNFLKPGNKPYLDNSYTDELTGKDSIKGKGVNQPTLNTITNPINSDDYYIKQTISSGGKAGALDSGLLGITDIIIKQGLDFTPVIDIKLTDIKGRALFEAGDNSPYATFFNLPYPLFHLTIKGYLGKAVRLSLMLVNFTSSYNSETSNFEITLKFYTYKYTVLTEITMGAILATPHMYQSRFNIAQSSGGPSETTTTQSLVVEKGFQKIREMYSEYKSKGLIPDDFPEITLMQLRDRLKNFIKNILDSFVQQNLDPLTDLKTYGEQLLNYQKVVFYTLKVSWFYEFMDTENFFILNNTPQKIYTFKKDLNPQKKLEAKEKLKSLILEYNSLLNNNKTCGLNGSYTINEKTIKCSIPNDIKYENFVKKINGDDINLTETYKQQRKNNSPTPEDLSKFKSELENEGLFNNLKITLKDGSKQVESDYFFFEGNLSFVDLTEKINRELKIKTNEIEEELTKALSDLLKKNDNGIGFVPTIRNILAVIFANGEAFLRLLDDVHTKAWEQRDSVIRKKVIFSSEISSASADNKTSGDDKNQPVYPWPQVIKATLGEKGQEKYELRYPGDSDIIGETKGGSYQVWPEIEFVEEFINGLTQKTPPSLPPTKSSNDVTEPNRFTLGAIEFPINNQVFQNKNVSKFLYEIYERADLTSHYSKLDRTIISNSESDKISNVIAEGETNNITKSLDYTSDVQLIKTLKEYNIPHKDFDRMLKNISNNGVSESYQNYIRGIPNTGYIKNLIENDSFKFISKQDIDSSLSQPLVSITNENDIVNYLNSSTTSNQFDFTDLYPFTDKEWVKNNLANGIATDEKLAFNTTKSLIFNTNKKVISNFSDSQNEDSKKPITNFIYKKIIEPTNYVNNLRNFYSTRTYTNQLLTEGDVKYLNYSGFVSQHQTTSILNTPYFINSIQQGVAKAINSEENPYVSSAYLFINSLPLATLREKYKTYNGTDTNYSDESLDYIFATMKKFAAIHKVPYAWVLKIGSIWHRYKKYLDTNIDILSDCWKDFDYLLNYDPVNLNKNKVYTVNIPGELSATTIVLENYSTGQTSSFSGTVTTMNVGFYPNLINSFNIFYQGYSLFTGYTDTDIQASIDKNELILSYVPEAVINNLNDKIPSASVVNKVIPWSVSVNTDYGDYQYIMPSHGSLINQTKDECINNLDEIVYTLSANTSMYNGSVRLFWASPNYGYFDNTKVTPPLPLEYLKQIFSGQESQENFSINGDFNNYAKMSEMFSVFKRHELDEFEKMFLKFSDSIYDYDETENSDETDTDKTFKNFQSLMRGMMKIANTEIEQPSVSQIQSKQLVNMSNFITKFLNYDIYFKIGNPSSFNKQLFYTFSSNHKIETPITWDYYNYNTPNSLPTTDPNSPSLSVSLFLKPSEWLALETYVGFSEISGLTYSDNGSFITDFFVDCNIAFDVYNIEKLAPMIKIYASQKLKDNTLNYAKFVELMNGYLDNLDSFNSVIIKNTVIKLQNLLPNVNFSPQPKIETVLESKQSKLELWESFKATNDKWISGIDFKSKTLFEDILLLDRASRDVGNIILVDIEKVFNDLDKINVSQTMLTYIRTILIDNHFVIMNIPSYVNFYNVQDAVKNPKPRPDGTLEFANSLFGTFLNVDYRESSAKMVCFYGGKPSEQLDLKDNVDYRFRNDAFDLRRQDNPLVENQSGKKDWDKSNKVVGFNIDFGPQNQSIFRGFSVTQDPGQSTAESLEMIYKMANQSNNKGSSSQNTGLYNLYKNRSYTCQVSMLGNAMIQPTMYFNLRHVPMFSGPYMITEVSHSINPGNFSTNFSGIRQATTSLPKIDNYLQTLKTTLLKSILERNEKNKQEKEKNNLPPKSPNSNIKKETDEKVKENTKQEAKSEINSSKCPPEIKKYDKFTVSETVNSSSASYTQVIDLITSKTSGKPEQLRYVVFGIMYLRSSKNGMLQSQSFNFSNTDLRQDWGPSIEPFFTSKKYYCGNSNTPYVVFDSLNQNVDFLISRYENRITTIKSISAADITKFIILNGDAGISEESVYTSMSSTDIKTIESRVQESIQKYNPISGNYTNTPPPVNVPAPNPFDFVVEEVGGSFNKLTVTIKPNVGVWKMFVAEYHYFKVTSECGNSQGSGRRLDEYFSANKETFTITKQNILDEEGCGLTTPQKDLVGKYTYRIWIYANLDLPVTNVGESSRQQSIWNDYVISFEIK